MTSPLFLRYWCHIFWTNPCMIPLLSVTSPFTVGILSREVRCVAIYLLVITMLSAAHQQSTQATGFRLDKGRKPAALAATLAMGDLQQGYVALAEPPDLARSSHTARRQRNGRERHRRKKKENTTKRDSRGGLAKNK